MHVAHRDAYCCATSAALSAVRKGQGDGFFFSKSSRQLVCNSAGQEIFAGRQEGWGCAVLNRGQGGTRHTERERERERNWRSHRMQAKQEEQEEKVRFKMKNEPTGILSRNMRGQASNGSFDVHRTSKWKLGEMQKRQCQSQTLLVPICKCSGWDSSRAPFLTCLLCTWQT